ncbi:MAG: DUF2024 family protein [Methylotenera sp.]
MKISVYDTYVQRPDGLRMHFDILVESALKDQETILGYGRTYLASKGLPSESLKAEECNYCHMESPNPAVAQEIAATGFAIIEMENCA